MPQVFNGLHYLIVETSWVDGLSLPPLADLSTIYSTSHINIVKLQHKSLRRDLLDGWLVSRRYVKFFENYWLSPYWAEQNNDRFMEEFFSFLAPTYDISIHSTNNLSCYDYLIDLAIQHKDTTGSKVLDFGCGSGILITSPSTAKLDCIVGYDFCDQMCALSRSRGMVTLSNSDFDSMPSNQYDIILINYVLHLGIEAKKLTHLVRLLMSGGVLVGNVHKDLHFNDIVVWLKSLPSNSISYQLERSKYGSVVILKSI